VRPGIDAPWMYLQALGYLRLLGEHHA
jgi:hypothetical protein